MVLVACGTRPQQPAAHPDWSYNSVVYEMNVRQYTPEGTLTAAARELPRLRELGVDVVWLMPVYPIGVKERKGTLGSYYAISDYEAVNPEFGTLEDFDRFVADAHRLGLRVILDWVANHTSPDARWIEEHPAEYAFTVYVQEDKLSDFLGIARRAVHDARPAHLNYKFIERLIRNAVSYTHLRAHET